MEYWDLLNEDKRATGRLHLRGEPIPAGFYHQVVDILTVNPREELLITLRHPDKHYGGKWEFTGGSALAGETSREAAARELSEETGLRAEPDALRLLLEHRAGSCFYDEYLYHCPQERPAITLQEGETVDFRWVTWAEFERMMRSGEICVPVMERYALLRDRVTF